MKPWIGTIYGAEPERENVSRDLISIACCLILPPSGLSLLFAEDSVGNTHLLEIKNSGYYTASFSNTAYPAIINAGRHGVPITIWLGLGVRLSRPLARLARKVHVLVVQLYEFEV